jgi:hypothetical protein
MFDLCSIRTDGTVVEVNSFTRRNIIPVQWLVEPFTEIPKATGSEKIGPERPFSDIPAPR